MPTKTSLLVRSWEPAVLTPWGKRRGPAEGLNSDCQDYDCMPSGSSSLCRNESHTWFTYIWPWQQNLSQQQVVKNQMTTRQAKRPLLKRVYLRVGCDVLKWKVRYVCRIPVGVCLQVKKGLCFCYRWSLDNRLRKRLDAGAGVGGPAVYPLVVFWILYCM